VENLPRDARRDRPRGNCWTGNVDRRRTPPGHFVARRKEKTVDLLILIILIVLLIAAFGPRAGWYGGAGLLWDLLSLIIFIVVLVWLLRLLGVLI
jgi:hypothetical protein